MSESSKKSVAKRFFVRQGILLVITIVLMIFCTIPFLGTLRTAINPKGHYASLEAKTNELADITGRIDVLQSKMLMGAGDDGNSERLRKENEELRTQAIKMQEEIDRLKRDLKKGRFAIWFMPSLSGNLGPTNGQQYDWRGTVENLTRTFGTLASLLTGTVFIASWRRRRS